MRLLLLAGMAILLGCNDHQAESEITNSGLYKKMFHWKNLETITTSTALNMFSSIRSIKMLALQLLICMFPACFSTPPAPSSEAVIQFDEYEHSFGTLSFKKETGYSFR